MCSFHPKPKNPNMKNRSYTPTDPKPPEDQPALINAYDVWADDSVIQPSERK
jgi:hypothetical protein